MEDVLGGRTSSERFSTFLASWEEILARRVDQAVAEFSAIDGVRGLILAGSIGRGEHWPLSDIDLLPIYDGALVDSAQQQIERRRAALLAEWIDQGWWTGLDIGRLIFTQDEVARALGPEGPNLTTLLQDDRWYHSLDKGYRGRAVFDPEGFVATLVNWMIDRRFSTSAVEHRLTRTEREVDMARNRFVTCAENGDALRATVAMRSTAKWLMTWQLEQWGERDSSQGRVGTRFERLARSYNRVDLVDALRTLLDQHDESVERRMAAAPAWVWERHDRSFRARQHVNEGITPLDDARDSLRVCELYESRRLSAPPFPAWLAIPSETKILRENVRRSLRIVDRWISENADRRA